MLQKIFKYLRFRQYVYWNIYDCLSDAKEEFKIHEYYVDDNQNQKDFQEYKRKKDLYFKVRESFIPIFISSLSLDEIKILDIGGGYNPVYDYVKDSTNQKINVTVLEKKTVVNTIYQLISEKINLNYIDDLNKKNLSNFDIIYFGSSFQYFLDNDTIITEISNLNAPYIIITDSCFLEKRKSFITLQVNTYPLIVPQRLNNIDEIINKFKMYDYNLIYKSKRKSGKHNLLLKGEYFTRDLIFKKSIVL